MKQYLISELSRKFSAKSKKQLITCHPLLITLFSEHIVYSWDCAILEGHRNKAAQDKYFAAGLSKLKWPNSKHNKTPSLAIDVAPYVNGKVSFDKMDCCYFAGKVMAAANSYGIYNLRWGGDWNGNGKVSDETFQDLVHFELVI